MRSLFLFILLTCGQASAIGWQYGRLTEAYEIGSEGKNLYTNWQEGSALIALDEDLPGLYRSLIQQWNVPEQEGRDEMDLLELLGQRGWELVDFAQNPGIKNVVIRNWYFKRPVHPLP